MRNSGTWREYMIQRLASDQRRIKGYLQAIMEEYQTFGDPQVILLALRTVAEAEGGISELAKRINIEPEGLSEELSSDNALTIDTLKAILNAFGCKFSIEPLETENLHHPATYSSDARLIRIASKATAASSKLGG